MPSDETGAIKNGVYWQEGEGEQGTYKIYNEGKVVKEEKISLNDIQNIDSEGFFGFE